MLFACGRFVAEPWQRANSYKLGGACVANHGPTPQQQPASMNRWRTTLPDDIQAPVDAHVSGDAICGLVVVIGTVVETLNPAFLPSPPYAVLAALCEDLLRWVVVAGPISPYAHVRSPIEAAGLTICTVDLRKVHPDIGRPDSVPAPVWSTVQDAARQYRTAHPQPAQDSSAVLLGMRPEGRA